MFLVVILFCCSCGLADPDPQGTVQIGNALSEWQDLSPAFRSLALLPGDHAPLSTNLTTETLLSDFNKLLDANAAGREAMRQDLILACTVLMERRPDTTFAPSLKQAAMSPGLSAKTRSAAFLAYYSITNDQPLAETLLDGQDDALRAAALRVFAMHEEPSTLDAAVTRLRGKPIDYTGTYTALALADAERLKELREHLGKHGAIADRVNTVLVRLPQLFTISPSASGLALSTEPTARYLVATLRDAYQEDPEYVKDALQEHLQENPQKKAMLGLLLEELDIPTD